jgi:thiol-disulfide isomerase/thioredoxin
MNKKIKIFISIVLILILVSCLYIVKEINEKNKVEAIISKIPSFSFLTLDNHSFSDKNIENRKSRIILNYFNPNCEHCQYMASEFLKDSQKIKDLQILMITSADSASVAKFNSDYKLSLLPNIIILRDTNYQFQKTFGTGVVPSFFIYQQNKLVKKVIGETIIDNLIN